MLYFLPLIQYWKSHLLFHHHEALYEVNHVKSSLVFYFRLRFLLLPYESGSSNFYFLPFPLVNTGSSNVMLIKYISEAMTNKIRITERKIIMYRFSPKSHSNERRVCHQIFDQGDLHGWGSGRGSVLKKN